MDVLCVNRAATQVWGARTDVMRVLGIDGARGVGVGGLSVCLSQFSGPILHAASPGHLHPERRLKKQHGLRNAAGLHLTTLTRTA